MSGNGGDDHDDRGSSSRGRRGGFLPDLASWALRGQQQQQPTTTDNNDGNSSQALHDDFGPPPTPEEMRAQRLARLQATTQPLVAAAAAASSDPMEVDNPGSGAVATGAKVSKPTVTPLSQAKATATTSLAKASSSPDNGGGAAAISTKKRKDVSDGAKKLQRKKEMLLKKVLQIKLGNSAGAHDGSVVCIDIGEAVITTQSVAEILATRLSLPKASVPVQYANHLMAYLGHCHSKAVAEKQTLNTKKDDDVELLELVQEIQTQLVNYAASCLLEGPDLFEQAEDAVSQWMHCLGSVTADPGAHHSIVVGGANSFYQQVMDEVHKQDGTALSSRIVPHMVQGLYDTLHNHHKDASVLEDGPLQAVSTLANMCQHKATALAATQTHMFAVPAAGTPRAREQVRPPMPSHPNNLMQLLAGGGQFQPYARRSGPGLEKETLLGVILRVGVPRSNNPAFGPTNILRQSLAAVDAATNTQRQQLHVYQHACAQLVLSLCKAGAAARSAVMTWLTDALLLNTHAAAMRPDPTKVSSPNLLWNVAVLLLKLCEPFVQDDSKLKLIDAGFVRTPAAHHGVFAVRGDDAVARLGSDDDNNASMDEEYAPKNAFIPQCFFLCARALHLAFVPGLSQHQGLLRHISHLHYEISNAADRDLQADPHFGMLVARQRSIEISLFAPEAVADHLRFGHAMARYLYEMDDDTLRTMPEDFVSDICDMMVSVAKLKAKLLGGLEFRYVFKLVVKLLSSKYAGMVRNYNLRAMMGDVLYELFLPPKPDDRRDVPVSVSTDSAAGGQTYLLSDAVAQETLAPSLLLLYGEVEQTGYYDKMSHRAKIASLIKYLWESKEHRPAFREITQNEKSFIKFANGMMNETNTLIATVMQKLPDIRSSQLLMRDAMAWGRLSEDEKAQISSRLNDNEQEVRHALPLCNKTLQMFGYLNTDADIRRLFLLDELCPRLVTMLLHVLTKLVGSKGLELKVDNPEQYDFRPKEMLRDLCAIFSLFAKFEKFQVACAEAGCDPQLLYAAVKTCRKLNLLTGESMLAFEQLPALVEAAGKGVAADEELLLDAPDEFLDEVLTTYMKDPVILPSGHYVDRSTITQHLLNDPKDPFNREPMTVDDIKPATELKERMNAWLEEKRRQTAAKNA